MFNLEFNFCLFEKINLKWMLRWNLLIWDEKFKNVVWILTSQGHG